MNNKLRKERIHKLLEKYEKKLVKYYLENGPYELRKKLHLGSADVWEDIFDYLVFNKEVVKICVRTNTEYLHEMFALHGPDMIRKTFRIEDEKYDDVWEYVMDYVGISRGAIFEYVNNESKQFRDLIYNGKSTQIRKKLGLEKNKYDNVWENVLDILLESVSTHQYSHSMIEQGIRMFSHFYNQGREHRSIRRKAS